VVNVSLTNSLYEIPLVLHEEGLDSVACELLGLGDMPVDLTSWTALVDMSRQTEVELKIGLVGKYVALHDAYLSVVEALLHGGIAQRAAVDIEWIAAEEVEGLLTADRLRNLDGVVIPGGFGERGLEGKVAAARFTREHQIPCLGICLGMQVMVVDYARHVLGLERAHSSEADPQTPHPVIDLMDDQREIDEKGGTMRLGAYVATLADGSQMADIYGRSVVSERHRHRYEFNPRYRSRFDDGDFLCSGSSPDGRLVEFVELGSHPFWLGTQAHPEFKSRPQRPAPLFSALIAAARVRHDRGSVPASMELEQRTPKSVS